MPPNNRIWVVKRTHRDRLPTITCYDSLRIGTDHVVVATRKGELKIKLPPLDGRPRPPYVFTSEAEAIASADAMKAALAERLTRRAAELADHHWEVRYECRDAGKLAKPA